MASPRFGRVLTAMVTPFTAEGDLDLDGAAELARWLVDHGNDGLVITGTTGEAPTLTDEEDVRPLDRGPRGGRRPRGRRRGHATTPATPAARPSGPPPCGVDGLLVVAPYYNKPSQAGFEAHYRAVAAVTDLPIVLYDIPGRTGRKIDTDVLVRLANEVPTIAALKDAAGNPGETARRRRRGPGRLRGAIAATTR